MRHSVWSVSRRKSVVNTSQGSRSIRKRIALAAFIILVIDNLTKSWAISSFSDGHTLHILGSLLQLQLATNSGAAFNFATSRTYLLTSLAATVLLALFLFARRFTAHNGTPLMKQWSLPLGLAMGGIMGNLSDRIFRAPGLFHGSVIDWIHLPHWPTFNIADSSLVIAGGISLYLISKGQTPWDGGRERNEQSEKH